MSIEYRGDNKYRFRVRKDGINYTQNFTSKKNVPESDLLEKKYPKEVTDAHKNFEVDVMRGEMGSNENMKFAELAQLVMDEYVKPQLKNSTELRYKSQYNFQILPEFGGESISKIKTIDIQKFINKKSKEGLMPSTIADIMNVFSATFNRAIKWKIVKYNPCKGVDLPKIEKTNYNELLTSDEMKSLIAAIKSEPKQMYKIIYLIALYGGLRKGEILGLTIDDIDFEDNSIFVNKQFAVDIVDGKRMYNIKPTKTTNSIRKVYVPKFVIDEIKDYVNNMKVIHQSKQLFWNMKSNKIFDQSTIYYEYKRLLNANNIKNITFHDLRHLNATMLINSGVNIVAVAKSLGDTVETISKTYVHDIDIIRKQSAEQLENFIEKMAK